MGKRELFALLNLSSWCLVMAGGLFLGVLWGCLQFVIVVFPDHTHLLFWIGRPWRRGGRPLGSDFVTSLTPKRRLYYYHYRKRHLDHNRILSKQSASVQDERIRTYMRVSHGSKSGTPIVMIVSDWHPIVNSIMTILSKRM